MKSTNNLISRSRSSSRRTASNQKEAHAGLSRSGSIRNWSSHSKRNSSHPTSPSSSTPVIWQGWLSKTGSKDSNFHKRFFRLHANGNFDYSDKEDGIVKGTCDLKVKQWIYLLRLLLLTTVLYFYQEATGVHPVKTGFNVTTPTR